MGYLLLLNTEIIPQFFLLFISKTETNTFQNQFWSISLLLFPVISTTGHYFCFGSTSSFFQQLFLHSSPVAYWGTYRPGEFTFHSPIFLPLHTVYGVLKARMLKGFVIPFFAGSHFVRTLHHDRSILGGPTWHDSQFH